MIKYNRFIALFICGLIVFANAIPANAQGYIKEDILELTDEANKSIRDINYHEGTLYEYVSINKNYTTTEGSRIYIADHKSNRNGETLGINTTVTYSVTLSGTLTSGSINKATASLGFSIGKSIGFGITKTSAGIKKGETCTAYYIPRYSVSEVKERQIAYTLKNGQYIKYKPTGVTRAATIKKPLNPSVQFVYSKGKSARGSSLLNEMRVETYLLQDSGELKLINVEEHLLI